MNQAEVSRFWTLMTWREIEDDPARYLLLLGKKLVYALNDFEIPNNVNIAFLQVVLPTLEQTAAELTLRLSSSGGGAADSLGYSVAVDGDRAIVGAPYNDDNGTDTGAAYVFRLEPGGEWVQETQS